MSKQKSLLSYFQPKQSQKPKPLEETDDDVIPESPDVHIKIKKKQSRKRRVIDDSDEEVSPRKKKKSVNKKALESNKKATVKPDLKEVKAADIFGGPIKRSEPLLKKKKNTETGIHSDEEFERSLLDLDETKVLFTDKESPLKPNNLASDVNTSNRDEQKLFVKDNNTDTNNDKHLAVEESETASKINDLTESSHQLSTCKSNQNNECGQNKGKKRTYIESKKSNLTDFSEFVNDSVIENDENKAKKSKTNKSFNESEITDEERHERRMQARALYQSYLNRSGPKNLGAKEVPEGSKDCLKECSFLLTGVLESFERDQITNIITQYGGIVKNAVTKKVTHVLAGDDAGPAKIAKAKQLGIPIINEDEFLQMIIDNSKNGPHQESKTKHEDRGIKSKNSKLVDNINTSKDVVVNSSKTEKRHSTKDKVSNSKLDSKNSVKIENISSPEKRKCDKNERTQYSVKIKSTEKSKIKSPHKGNDLKKESSTETKKSKHESITKESAEDKPSHLQQGKIINKTKDDSSQIKDEVNGHEPVSNENPDISTQNLMWVEKYKPNNLKQIIGQHGDNSNVKKLINWLTKWYVNRKVKTPKPSPWAKNDDGAYFKACLLSGPPGVGKTTTVSVVCKELGFDMVEFNASDTRNKTLIKEQIGELLTTTSLSSYAKGNTGKQAVSKKHVLVMDEVDGMSGNEDRGGMQELINLIKSTSVPIICMCNDRNSQKMRSLLNYVYELKFSRPNINQLKAAMLSICSKEGIKIRPEALVQLITACDRDVRQTLNLLSMWAVGGASTDDIGDNKKHKRDVKLGPWEAVRKVFTMEEHKNMSLNEKSDLFFYDYSLAPLFVQENYLSVEPHHPKNETLHRVSRAADSISIGDLVDARIRSGQAWSLLPIQAMYSSVIPGNEMSGHITKMINFPAWLGKNSRANKMQRLCQEIHAHTRLSTSGSKSSIFLDYAPHLRDSIVNPLIKEHSEGIDKSIAILESYHLLREDLDSLVELSLWPGQRNPTVLIDSKVKAAMTRTFNKNSTALPYAPSAVKKNRARREDVEGEEYGDEVMDDDDEVEQDDEDPETDALIKKKKSKESDKASTSKEKASSSKDKRKKKK